MEQPSRKRQRANTNGEAGAPAMPIVPQHNLNDCIDAIYEQDNGFWCKTLLVQMSNTHPDIAALLRSTYEDLLRRERRRVVSFDHYSYEVWHQINSSDHGVRDSIAFEFAFEVLVEIRDILGTIADSAGSAYASFGTKRSGLETLRKIGKTICLSGDNALGSEVQKKMGYDDTLTEAMQRIIGVMDVGERAAMCQIHDGRSTFLWKMDELVQLSESYTIFEGLVDVVRKLSSPSISSEDEDGGKGPLEEEEEDDDENSEDADLRVWDGFDSDGCPF